MTLLGNKTFIIFPRNLILRINKALTNGSICQPALGAEQFPNQSCNCFIPNAWIFLWNYEIGICILNSISRKKNQWKHNMKKLQKKTNHVINQGWIVNCCFIMHCPSPSYKFQTSFKDSNSKEDFFKENWKK